MTIYTNATADNLGQFLIGNSDAMVKLRREIVAASKWDFPLIVEGESGTGKDLVANLVFALWLNRRDKKGNLVAVDCGTLKELLHSRLFGHKKGGFTGASADSLGIFGEAQNGGIFFDELGNLTMEAQTYFLRALESKTYTPVGDTKEKIFEGRFIGATNKALMPMVKNGAFRGDLLYRMNRIAIRTPNLRDHVADIPAIAKAYLENLKPQIFKATGREDVTFSMDAFDGMVSYKWPGNVRELYSVIDRALVSMPEGVNEIKPEFLHFEGDIRDLIIETSPFDSCRTLQDFERAALELTLRKHKGNQSKAAAQLGIERSTLGRKLRSYELLEPKT